MRFIVRCVAGVVLCLPLATQGQTHVEGRIGVDTVWDAAGSPYVLTGDVEVAGGATLAIEAGVRVEGMAGTRLIVGGEADGDAGTLRAQGAEFARVDFRAHDADRPWGGILFRQNASDAVFSAAGEFLDGSIISRAYVWQADAPISMMGTTPYLESIGVVGPTDPAGSGIFVELRPTTKRLRMRGVEVDGSAGFGLFVSGGGGHVLEDCRFESNGQGVAMQTLIRTSPDFPRDRIERCVFVRNGLEGGPWSHGGGMSYTGTHAEFTDCQFYSNSARMNGGGAVGACHGRRGHSELRLRRQSRRPKRRRHGL